MTIRLDGHESSKEEKRHYRKNLFFQLEGIPIVAIVTALDKAGLIDYISDKQGIRLRHLTEKFNANEGYLAVALRLLSTQGYLIQKIDEQGRNYTPSDHYHILLKMKKIAGSKTHKPVREGKCAACHDIHGSDGAALIAPEAGEKSCTACHARPSGNHHAFTLEEVAEKANANVRG